jgi:4-methylaminobutanoate oxidase (formaldehyde-forming)
MLWGGELVLRDVAAVGQLTSAAWGETVGRPVGLGYLWHPAGEVVTREFLDAGSYEINAGGDRYPATVSLRPPFDPAGTRVRDS